MDFNEILTHDLKEKIMMGVSKKRDSMEGPGVRVS